MATAVDEQHRAAMRTFREETAELHLGAAARLSLSDVDIAVFAESVELAAVAIYTDSDVAKLVDACWIDPTAVWIAARPCFSSSWT